MAEKDTTTTVDTGNQPTANTVVNPDTGQSTEVEPQKADQFYTGGWTEASRIEDTAAAQEAEREAAEKAAKKEAKG